MGVTLCDFIMLVHMDVVYIDSQNLQAMYIDMTICRLKN